MDFPRSLAARTETTASLRTSLSMLPSRPATETDPLGLLAVTNPEEPIADIIFVHGLGGSAYKTWSWERNPDNFWPTWLARDDNLGDVRIFTYGYNSNPKGDAHGLDIIDFSKDLLMQMLNYSGGIGNDRPVLFVTHSMGGLVVKKAYMLGKHDQRFANLISSVAGIVFLATPHRGSQYAKTLNNILAATPTAALPKAYIAALERQSPAIQDINEGFSHQCEGISLVSFYETLPTKRGFTSLLVVEKDSAVLGYRNEMSASMKADHSSISKFRDESDSNFVILRDTLRRLVPKPAPRDDRQTSADHMKEIQGILGIFDVALNDLHTHKHHIPRNSGSWLASEKGFAAWRQATRSSADPRYYWLLGLPGSGKTVLSTIVIDQFQCRDQVVQHHFFSEAHQEKRTVAYGLRSIATQLALNNESFRKALLSFHKETGLSFSNQDQSFHSIWEKIFEGIVFRHSFPRPLVWVFDAVDESDTPDMLLNHFSQVQSQTPIKVFFSSRPLKAISRFDSAQTRSYFLREDDTAEDIRRYAANVVRQALPDDELLLDDIVTQTMKNSSGSFLWVKLALDALEENWHTQDDIRAVLTEFPNGMVPTYKRMLRKIESQAQRSRNMARSILTWATCSWRPLHLDELQVALEPEFSKFVNLEDTVTQICGHFIKLTATDSQKQVSLIHKTARDFLFKGDPDSGTAPFINLQEGHRHLAIVCLRYLSNDHWRRHFDSIHVATSSQAQAGPANNTPNRLLMAEKGHPLLGYASCYWAYHVSKSPVISPELKDVLRTFLSKYFLTWVEAISLSGDLRYLTRSAQYLKAYAKRHSRFRGLGDEDRPLTLTMPPEHDADWIQNWAVDTIRLVGKFGSGLICDPPSVYRQLPSFCPRNSMIGQTYGTFKQESLTVSGLKAKTWDDCLASVSVGKDDYASQVLATDAYFITLVSSSGSLIVWNAETCEQQRVIRAGRYVPLMAVNKAGTSVATVAFDNYSVWELLTGRLLYTCRKPASDGIVLDLRFGTADYELVICFNTNKVDRIDLRSGGRVEHPIPHPVDPDFSYQGCPWRMALSPDLTKVAAAWRGRPPLIWDLVEGAMHVPRKCRISSPVDSICAPELLRWHPDTEALFVLCQDTKVIEWRIYEGEQKEWGHITAREIIISGDGNSLLSSDHMGTISIWNFPRLNLAYRLINEDQLSADLTFSPGCQRFYDVRGSVCNVWEPDALVRADEQEMEDRSSTGGTTILTDPTISHFDAGGQLVTALALDSKDRYYCCGREDGRVSIHDAASGRRLRKVYSHWKSSTVVALCWSESGKYIVSCDDGGFVIAKRLQAKEEGAWGVFPVFNCRLDEPVSQFVFSAAEQFLLVSTPSADRVWDLRAKKEVGAQRWEGRQSRRWIQHPHRGDLLVWISPSEVRCHRWPTLEAVEPPADPDLPSPPAMSSDDAGTPEKPGRCVSWASATADKRSILYATLPDDSSLTMSRHPHGDLRIESVDASDTLRSTGVRPAPGIAGQVKHLLGVYKSSVVFLDHDYWLCTWGPRDGPEAVARHFFIPKDWLNTSTSHMAAVSPLGTFFCPRYGEVAVVRNGIRM